MKRRMLPFISCLIVLLAVNSFSMAAHNHNYVVTGTSSTWELDGPCLGGHRYCIYRYLQCSECGMTKKEIIQSKVEACSYHFYSDGGHATTGTVHYYNYRCAVCGHIKLISQYCSGPPCVIPQNIDFEQ